MTNARHLSCSAAPNAPRYRSARGAADTLIAAALSLLDGRTDNLFGDWSIADIDLAMMLQRLIVLGDPVPQPLINYAAIQWHRPSVRQWIQQKRPAASQDL